MSDNNNATVQQGNPLLPVVQEYLKSASEWRELVDGVGSAEEGADLGQWSADVRCGTLREWLDAVGPVQVCLKKFFSFNLHH
jgi:hypothetical protein